MSTLQKGVCPKCKQVRTLYRHHTKYGDNESIILICRSCHNYIHNKIRKTNGCPLQHEAVVKLSTASCRRYYNRLRQRIFFSTSLARNIRLYEEIVWVGDSMQIHTGYRGDNGAKLKYIDEVKKPCA